MRENYVPAYNSIEQAQTYLGSIDLIGIPFTIEQSQPELRIQREAEAQRALAERNGPIDGIVLENIVPSTWVRGLRHEIWRAFRTNGHR